MSKRKRISRKPATSQPEQVASQSQSPEDLIPLNPRLVVMTFAFGDAVEAAPTKSPFSINSVVLSADGHMLVSGSRDRTIKLWNISTGELLRTLTGHAEGVTSIALNSTGDLLASGSQDETIKLWNVSTGELLLTLNGHTDEVLHIALSADGHMLVSGSWDETIKLWDARSGELLLTLSGHKGPISSLALSADGHTLVSGSWDETIKLWDAHTGKLLRSFEAPAHAEAADRRPEEAPVETLRVLSEEDEGNGQQQGLVDMQNIQTLGKESTANNRPPVEDEDDREELGQEQNFFSLSISQLKRHSTAWREVLKPLLGVLLVAHEPLSERQLRGILSLDEERLRKGIAQLEGIIADDGRNRYTLFHLKLYDYLRQDESKPHKEYIFTRNEEEGWHNTLAQWCEQNGLSLIWEDALHDPTEQERRGYARRHYLMHLYLSHEWQQHDRKRLFEILDTLQYGLEKIQTDQGTASYAFDLDLGREATMWEGWTNEETMYLLPRLWQYTLIRCSLSSHANQYPEEAFRLLILLGRKQEALGLAELLTDPTLKVKVLQQVAHQLREQTSMESEWLELLMQASEVAGTIQDSYEQVKALRDLGTALAQAGQEEQALRVWDAAERTLGTMPSGTMHTEASSALGAALSQAGQWAAAERVISTISDSPWLADSQWQAKALSALGTALAQAGQEEQASRVWAEAERIIGAIQDSQWQAYALSALGTALAQAGQEEQASRVLAEAQRVIDTIQDGGEQAWALSDLGTALAQTGQEEQALRVWADAEGLLSTISDAFGWRTQAASSLGIALARAGQWAAAERVISTIQDSSDRADALEELGTALAQVGQEEQVLRMAEHIRATLPDGYRQTEALKELGKGLSISKSSQI